MTVDTPNELLEWVTFSFEGWKLKEGAPKEMKVVYEEFMKNVDTQMNL